MEKKRGGIAGKIISAVFLLEVLAFMGLLVYIKMVPVVVLAIAGVILLLLVFTVTVLTWKTHNAVRFVMGTVLALIFTVLLVLGGMYVYKTTSTLSGITGVNTEIAQMGVYVRADDAAATAQDASGYTYGILSTLDRENTDTTVAQLGEELGVQLQTKEYQGLTDLVDGLLREETGAIILNQAYFGILEEIDGYADVESRIKEISVQNVETTIAPETTADNGSAAQDTASGDGKVYTVYISGIDNRGGIVAKSRSDVNIIAVANTATRQLLLVSTPRDYFIPLSISGGVPDKLTHAGIYGINVCMDTLGMLYDIDINNYFRLNFDGFTKIIDALGGITVNSDYEFDSKNTTGYHFVQGENQVNGEQALVFARERYAFKEGDRQRGKNQMAVIKGVVDKAMSPELLKNYSSILSSVEGCFETNIAYEEIARLLQQQLTSGGSWNVVTYSVDGSGDTQKPYSMSQNAYVMVPDYTTVDHAKQLIKDVTDGLTITQE